MRRKKHSQRRKKVICVFVYRCIHQQNHSLLGVLLVHYRLSAEGGKLLRTTTNDHEPNLLYLSSVHVGIVPPRRFDIVVITSAVLTRTWLLPRSRLRKSAASSVSSSGKNLNISRYPKPFVGEERTNERTGHPHLSI